MYALISWEIIYNVLIRFADNIKLGREDSILEGRAALQEDNRLEKWAMRKPLQFNKRKHKNCTWAE